MLDKQDIDFLRLADSVLLALGFGLTVWGLSLDRLLLKEQLERAKEAR